MKIFKTLKKLITGSKKLPKSKESLTSNEPFDPFANRQQPSPKVKEFIEGEIDEISAKDVFPEMKVFTPHKKSKNPDLQDLNERLKNAKKNLYLPAAFKDILISLRKIIRVKMKENNSYINELNDLYLYACQYNFFKSKERLDRADELTYNLSEVIKPKEFSSLKMPYNEIGYLEISQLNKTDIKWLINEFGEPSSHQSVSEYHKEYMLLLEDLLIQKRKKEHGELWDL